MSHKYTEDGYEIEVRSTPTEIKRKIRKPKGNLEDKKASMTRQEWNREVRDIQAKHILESNHRQGGQMSNDEAMKIARESVERCERKGKI